MQEREKKMMKGREGKKDRVRGEGEREGIKEKDVEGTKKGNGEVKLNIRRKEESDRTYIIIRKKKKEE